MKKWFQVFIDEEDSDESIPMRFDPDKIFGIKKYTTSSTILYTNIGQYRVCEDYDSLCKRLFAFVNSDESDSFEENKIDSRSPVRSTTRKRIIIKKKIVDDSYYDHFQPETTD